MKRCPHCGRELPHEAFARNARSRDGLQSWCRECMKRAVSKSAARTASKRAKYRDDRARFVRMMDAAARHDVEVVHIAGLGDVAVELPPMEGEEWD